VLREYEYGIIEDERQQALEACGRKASERSGFVGRWSAARPQDQDPPR
jgi:hypothetical protein